MYIFKKRIDSKYHEIRLVSKIKSITDRMIWSFLLEYYNVTTAAPGSKTKVIKKTVWSNYTLKNNPFTPRNENS